MKNLSSVEGSKNKSSKSSLTPEELASIKGGATAPISAPGSAGGCVCCICYSGQGGAGDATAGQTGSI